MSTSFQFGGYTSIRSKYPLTNEYYSNRNLA
jgi:hypothetical protein